MQAQQDTLAKLSLSCCLTERRRWVTRRKGDAQ